MAIGFTVNASAFLGEIWRGAIQAVPRGQTEAAMALGLHYSSRMRDIVLPQAIRISLPATIGYLVQLIKGTSLAAIVGFIELARAGQIVSNQTFQPLLVFGVVGAMYFILCWPLSWWGRPDGGQARPGQSKVGTAHLLNHKQPSSGGDTHVVFHSIVASSGSAANGIGGRRRRRQSQAGTLTT